MTQLRLNRRQFLQTSAAAASAFAAPYFVPASAFGHQPERVFDQLRGVEEGKLLFAGTQAVSHPLEPLHIIAPYWPVVCGRQADRFCVAEWLEPLAFDANEHGGGLHHGIEPRMATARPRKPCAELYVNQLWDACGFKAVQRW